MEFLTGLTPEETLELEELLDASRIGTEVRVRGAVHTIRDMGELSFCRTGASEMACCSAFLKKARRIMR